ncbi:MAG: hypothetical protein JRJ69_12500 [Deltaproteobacteria bacterium]|nr:hypothetical protein [Deltaproteobacteria bacterium]MBW1738338.1 hypothetical protein [Deltaproteobacteria bacterium]MBW1910438.1 hypothetical protein [Deltaproteobacteria bacterium]MBW2034757.1 hypothetical protein [Deltaproteobacteria bacterium]MBW2113409.1 hypothetical protein [Deltaproteobacteria bacterium]
MTKKILMAILFCLTIFAVLSDPAMAFRTSDLEGTWHGYLAGIDTVAEDGYWISLKLDIDSTGDVQTTSTYTDPSGSTKNFTGGSLALDGSGKLTGNLINAEATVTVRDGKMDRGKTVIGFADTTDDDHLHVGKLIKAGGASFQDSDLAGTWHGYLADVDTDTGDSCWVHLKLVLNSSGEVQTTSTWEDSDGSSGNFTGGDLDLDSTGKLTGTLNISTVTITIEDGKMDQAKTYAGIVYNTNDNTMGKGNLVKTGGSFTTSNLQGTWHGYYLEIESDGDAYWIYATLEVNSSGGVEGGSFYGPLGLISTFNGGTLTLDGNGILGGTITTTAGNTATISHGKMDQGKTIVDFVDTTSNSELDVGMFIKAGIPGSNVGSQLLLLLGD